MLPLVSKSASDWVRMAATCSGRSVDVLTVGLDQRVTATRSTSSPPQTAAKPSALELTFLGGEKIEDFMLENCPVPIGFRLRAMRRRGRAAVRWRWKREKGPAVVRVGAKFLRFL